MGTLSGARTTPEATEVQRVLAGVRDRQRSDGRRHAVAMEVSSHALVQARVEGVHFDVAVFTNLSHDHLDYHGTMEAYFEAKRMLFTPDHALRGVVNADDPWGQRLLARVRIPAWPSTALMPVDIVLAPGRTEFTWRGSVSCTALTGAINVTTRCWRPRRQWPSASTSDEVADALRSGLAGTGPAAGHGHAAGQHRRRRTGRPSPSMVDYAHTPAGLEVVLGEARTLAAPAGGFWSSSAAAATGTGPSARRWGGGRRL